ncbi:sigma-54 interaction domain-containing protein [Desulfobotulus mexicanus]|uniref:Sigma-54-dependent Fis family transcriptional regulator n=1 Tax=Desulfobotulus mexicanus TaxID=2586642 RepID=A0A5Q4VCJ5_9BACT|nr:sigma-54 dependent transcriptional regulator [Desulfobotulus mexicanus]TYT74693.1 sigma-54-dependent Fis family transcriptional regulator [Desulfobotulus mexicanus]
MTDKSPLPPDVERLLKLMEQICHDLVWNRYDRAETLFELTRSTVCPEPIASLAESFGMMLVKIEAREFQMEEMLKNLKETSKALEISRRQLLKENEGLKKGLMERFSPKRIVGQSQAMRHILDQTERIADTSVNVLITGETGTGKELIAKALHYNSIRKSGPFIAINCSAIPESLFESELFGIEKGIATGVNMRKGLVEQAGGGTIFLDEIGDMPLNIQAKILRVLEEREVTRVGGSTVIPVDLRVVAATHRNLKAEAKAGHFREDLFFRLNVISLALPPLRERPGDIPLLLQRFLDLHCRQMNRPLLKISKEAMDCLLVHNWPGNVRELENEVERVVALSYSEIIHVEDLSLHIQQEKAIPESNEITVNKKNRPPLSGSKGNKNKPAENLFSLEENEKELIERTLEAANGNKTKAARMLGISREGLRKKMKKLFDGNAP